MIAKKGSVLYDNLASVIIFAILTLLVFTFLVKYYSVSRPVADWSKSLNSVKNAVNNLDKENLELTRSANINLEGYVIKGFGPGAICPDEKSPCVCACKNPECSNAQDNNKKYCRIVLFQPADDFIINPTDGAIITYILTLEKIGDSPRVIISNIIR